MENYTKDLDLEKYFDEFDIANMHKKKFIYLMNLLLMNEDNTQRISQNDMESIFARDYYTNIRKEFTIIDEYSLENGTVIHSKNIKFEAKPDKEISKEEQLFYRLFKRNEKGDSYRKVYNEFTVNLSTNELDSLVSTYDNISFKKYVDKKMKVEEDTVSNLLRLDKKYLKKWLKENKKLYGKTATNTNNNLTDNQFGKRKSDYQYLKQLVDIETRGNDTQLIYNVKKSGRMYTRIQGMTREIRNVLLHDYTENDISGASPNFFIQVFDKIVYDKNSTLLKDYTDNYIKKYKKANKDKNIHSDPKYNLLKKIERRDYNLLERYITGGKNDIRQGMANVIKGEDIEFIDNKTKHEGDKQYLDLSKEILTMIFFGAKTKSEVTKIDTIDFTDEGLVEESVKEGFKTSIQSVLTPEQRNRFFENTVAREFLLHSEILMDIISIYLKSNHAIDNVLTVNGKTIIMKTERYDKKSKEWIITNRYSKSKALAFFYQTWESNILLEMKKVYLKNCTKETDKRYLLIHDGIYTKMEIDKSLFENLESKDNNFNVSYTVD